MGNLEASADKAFEDNVIPGAIIPPRYSPLSDTQSNVVAVPKSTTIKLFLIFSYAPTALTILSAPNSSGLSISKGIFVIILLLTITGSIDKILFIIFLNIAVKEGTTLEIIAPFTKEALILYSFNISRKNLEVSS